MPNPVIRLIDPKSTMICSVFAGLLAHHANRLCTVEPFTNVGYFEDDTISLVESSRVRSPAQSAT